MIQRIIKRLNTYNKKRGKQRRNFEPDEDLSKALEKWTKTHNEFKDILIKRKSKRIDFEKSSKEE